MIKIKKIHHKKSLKEILNIRNKPYVRQSSHNKRKILLQDHKKWFERFTGIKSNKIYGMFLKGNLIGYITIESSKKNNVSWYLKKDYWGKVNFYNFLKSKTKQGKFTANVKIKNIASLILALKSGFHIFKIKNDIVYFKK